MPKTLRRGCNNVGPTLVTIEVKYALFVLKCRSFEVNLFT